jgi:hypothetical protein
MPRRRLRKLNSQRPAEASAAADRGRPPGFARLSVLAGGPGGLAGAFGQQHSLGAPRADLPGTRYRKRGGWGGGGRGGT